MPRKAHRPLTPNVIRVVRELSGAVECERDRLGEVVAETAIEVQVRPVGGEAD